MNSDCEGEGLCEWMSTLTLMSVPGSVCKLEESTPYPSLGLSNMIVTIYTWLCKFEIIEIK